MFFRFISFFFPAVSCFRPKKNSLTVIPVRSRREKNCAGYRTDGGVCNCLKVADDSYGEADFCSGGEISEAFKLRDEFSGMKSPRVNVATALDGKYLGGDLLPTWVARLAISSLGAPLNLFFLTDGLTPRQRCVVRILGQTALEPGSSVVKRFVVDFNDYME